MPPGGLQRKTCRPIQQRRHERHELVERAGVFRPLADDLVVDGENDRIACALDPDHAGRHEVAADAGRDVLGGERSEEHTSELQSLMRISYAVFCLKKKTTTQHKYTDL